MTMKDRKVTMTSITLRLANIRNPGRQHRFNTAFAGLIRNKMMGKCQRGHSEDRNESVPYIGKRLEKHLNYNPGNRCNFYFIKMI